MNPERSTVRVPQGVELDFGATAKALCADRAARAIADATGAGVLVSLGGDVAIDGPPPDSGWPLLIADDHAADPSSDGQRIVVRVGWRRDLGHDGSALVAGCSRTAPRDRSRDRSSGA